MRLFAGVFFGGEGEGEGEGEGGGWLFLFCVTYAIIYWPWVLSVSRSTASMPHNSFDNPTYERSSQPMTMLSLGGMQEGGEESA